MSSQAIRFCASVLLASAMAGSLADAQTLSSTFEETQIPDAQPDGLTIKVGAAPAIAAVNLIQLQLAHEWAGDLTVRLIPPSGSAITLLDRPGLNATAPDGSSAVLGNFVLAENNSFRLAPAVYTFAASGLDLPAQSRIAEAVLPPVLPASSAYAAQSWNPGPFAAGDWQLFVADAAETSSGLIISVELSYSAVPEPTTSALLALTVLAAAARAPVKRAKALRN